MTELGELREVSLREAWDHEAHSFTPWLCDHLERLGETIGIELEFVSRETRVQQFAADILAQDVRTGKPVLIENQLEKSDHRHLGQILTYLSGLGAETVVWIAADFEDAHLSALNWLNDHTVEPFAFLAVRVKVVRIGDSLPAPLFEVIARPNDWDRQIQAVAPRGESELGQFRRAFWSHVIERDPESWEGVPPSATSSMWWGEDHWEVQIILFIARDSVGVFIRGPRGQNDNETTRRLAPIAEEIAEAIGVPMHSDQSKRLFASRLHAETSDRHQWDRLADWITETANRYFAGLEQILDDDSS